MFQITTFPNKNSTMQNNGTNSNNNIVNNTQNISSENNPNQDLFQTNTNSNQPPQQEEQKKNKSIIELQKVWKPLHDNGIALQPNNVIEFILNSSDELSFQDNIMQHLQDAFQAMFRSPSWGEDAIIEDSQLQSAVDLLARNGFVYMLREDARDMYIDAALRTLHELFKQMIDDLCEYYTEEREAADDGQHIEASDN